MITVDEIEDQFLKIRENFNCRLEIRDQSPKIISLGHSKFYNHKKNNQFGDYIIDVMLDAKNVKHVIGASERLKIKLHCLKIKKEIETSIKRINLSCPIEVSVSYSGDLYNTDTYGFMRECFARIEIKDKSKSSN